MSCCLNRFVVVLIFCLSTQLNFGTPCFGQSPEQRWESPPVHQTALIDDLELDQETARNETVEPHRRSPGLLSDSLLLSTMTQTSFPTASKPVSPENSPASRPALSDESVSIAETRSIESACLEADGIVAHLNEQVTQRLAVQKAQLADVLMVAIEGAADQRARRRAIETALTMATDLGSQQARFESTDQQTKPARIQVQASPNTTVQRSTVNALQAAVNRLAIEKIEQRRHHEDVAKQLRRQIESLSKTNKELCSKLSNERVASTQSMYQVNPSSKWNVTLLSPSQKSIEASVKRVENRSIETTRERLPNLDRSLQPLNQPKPIAINRRNDWRMPPSSTPESLRKTPVNQVQPLQPLPVATPNVSLPELQAIKAEVMRLNRRLDSLLDPKAQKTMPLRLPSRQ